MKLTLGYYSDITQRSPKMPNPDEYAQMTRSGEIKDVAETVGILKFLQTNITTLTLVCDPSVEQDLTNLGFSHMRTVQEALNEATARLGHDSKVLAMPYGGSTHPTPF